MVKFDFPPCDKAPSVEITCSQYELDAKIVYPPSYGDKRTEIQKIIEFNSGFEEKFPTVNIGPVQFCLGKGNVVRLIFLYFSGLKKEDFIYQEDCEYVPLVSLAPQNIGTRQEDLYFNEQVSVKIDRDSHVICVFFGENANIYQTFSLSDNLILRAGEDGNLVALVFHNVHWIDMETESAVPQQSRGIIRCLLSGVTRYVRTLF
ncbi:MULTISPECIES: hypothetical protein [Acetobacter]|uniref:hypothetical protein n=1 Tax=Acetobacter TaxID=434 RepID=UPI00376F6272